MQSFIVLGLVPGTQFETTFTFWVVVSGIFILLLNLSSLFILAEKIHTLIVVLRINIAVSNFELKSI